MSGRIPPGLLYLTIYNPALRPTRSNKADDDDEESDDEDAEEQAQILFYTSRERAVSRDRMLRQVGLAKALVNFSEMFNDQMPAGVRSVHSQSKRMVMVSPEPDFWIHAAVEVAKVPINPKDGKKGKEKVKIPEKGKTKEPVYEYIEGSVHDSALRQDILRGYERFKLTHGTFASILQNLGREALELQLERFFTVWAWSWDLEEGRDLGLHLGVPLHPRHRSLISLADNVTNELSEDISTLLIIPPYAIPSTSYISTHQSASLARYLLSLYPKKPPNASQESVHSDKTIKSKRRADDSAGGTNASNGHGKDPPSTLKDRDGPRSSSVSSSSFLGLTNVNMDVRKWSWPGYLTFGRGTDKEMNVKSGRIVADGYDVDGKARLEKPHYEDGGLQQEQSQEVQRYSVGAVHESEVDKGALDDAIASNGVTGEIRTSGVRGGDDDIEVKVADEEADPRSGLPDSVPTSSNGHANEGVSGQQVEEVRASHIRSPADVDAVSLTPSASSTLTESATPQEAAEESLPNFLSTTVYLSDFDNPSRLNQRKVFYTLSDGIMLAFLRTDVDDADVGSDISLGSWQTIGKRLPEIYEKIREVTGQSTPESTEILPSIVNILQPTDRYIASSAGWTVSSPGFESCSSILYHAQELQNLDADVTEVFSRGQNPQHWHIAAKRSLGPVKDDGRAGPVGEVYLEVFRKETSLTDVDNVLAGIVRRCEMLE